MLHADKQTKSPSPFRGSDWLWLCLLAFSIVLQGSVLPRTVQSATGLVVAADSSALLAHLRDHQRHGVLAADANKTSHSDGEAHELLLAGYSAVLPVFSLRLSVIVIQQWRAGPPRFTRAIPRAPPAR